MAITRGTYGGRAVLLYTDGSTSVESFCIPLAAMSRKIINNYQLVGYAWETRAHDSIKKTQYELDASYVLQTGEERKVLMDFWSDMTFAKFYIPSWKKDYNITTVNSTTSLDISRSYIELTGVTRHVAVFADGNLTTAPSYRKITSSNVDATTDRIVLDSAVTSMTTSTVICNLFLVNMLSDDFTISNFGKNKTVVSLNFIEDQRATL
jgi:hypothetical protein